VLCAFCFDEGKPPPYGVTPAGVATSSVLSGHLPLKGKASLSADRNDNPPVSFTDSPLCTRGPLRPSGYTSSASLCSAPSPQGEGIGGAFFKAVPLRVVERPCESEWTAVSARRADEVAFPHRILRSPPSFPTFSPAPPPAIFSLPSSRKKQF